MDPESLNSSTAGGRVLWSTKPAPLLVLAGCWGLQEITTTENKNQKEKPLTQNSLQNRTQRIRSLCLVFWQRSPCSEPLESIQFMKAFCAARSNHIGYKIIGNLA